MIKFSDLTAEPVETKVVQIKEGEIAIKQYLPVGEKSNIIEMALQNSTSQTIIDYPALMALFNTYVVIKYTDIIFTPDEKSDPIALYDKLDQAGIIDLVWENIPAAEASALIEQREVMFDEYKKYTMSITSAINNFLMGDSARIAEMNEQIADFNPDKAKEVMAIAEAAGISFDGSK